MVVARKKVRMTDATRPGPLALVGSGEYLAHMMPLEAELLRGRAPRYVQLATAAVPDGPDVVTRWHRLGREQAARLQVEAVVVPVANRDDANDESFAAMIEGAGLIYLSGGNPTFLAETLRDTKVWAAIKGAWQNGSALAGCSAGAMALTSWVPSLRHPRGGGTAGLGLLNHLRVIPHFDAFVARMPDVVTQFLVPSNEHATLLGIDEDTAIVGGLEEWTVWGRQSAWRLHDGTRDQLATGTTFRTAIQPS